MNTLYINKSLRSYFGGKAYFNAGDGDADVGGGGEREHNANVRMHSSSIPGCSNSCYSWGKNSMSKYRNMSMNTKIRSCCSSNWDNWSVSYASREQKPARQRAE